MTNAKRRILEGPGSGLWRWMRLRPPGPLRRRDRGTILQRICHPCGLLFFAILLSLALPGTTLGQQIVGYSDTGGGSYHAFLWQNGVMTDLGTLGGTISIANAINDAGQVVGLSYIPGNSIFHAFLWQNGVMTDLGTLGGTSSSATGINNAGQVVGYAQVPGGSTHAFLWQNGVMTDLGTFGGEYSIAWAINNAGQVVGEYRTPGSGGPPIHPFLWQNGVMTDLGTLGGSYSSARGINNAGQVVGESIPPASNFTHAFLWQNGVMTDLGVGSANGINNAGQIVGESQNAAGQSHAFLWQNGVMTDLGTLGGQFSLAFGINDPNLLLDPVPDLMSGPSTISGSLLQTLGAFGRPVRGAAADGVAEVVIRIPAANVGDHFTLTLVNDQNSQIIPSEDGALGNPGDTSFSQSQITVSAIPVNPRNGQGPPTPFAFAVYRAPVDFARPTGPTTYKSGTCAGATKSDDQLICRSVSIKIQTPNGSTSTAPVIIVRPPVIMIHGLWDNWATWNNLSPLVSSAKTVDPRFSIGRVSYDTPIGSLITSSNPAYTQDLLQAATGNSLGFQYNVKTVLAQVNQWIGIENFKGGRNPASIPVAAVQADIVAHSMGGNVARTLVLQPTFLSDNTFGQGNIHKVITVDTPHLGTPLASRLLTSQESCIRQRILAPRGKFVFSAATFSDGQVPSGAVSDLATSSTALASIATPGPLPLPTALIAGVYQNFGSTQTSFNANLIFLICGTSDPLAQSLVINTATSWPAIFNNEENDALVSKSSQLNGLDPSLGFVFPGFVHSPGTEDLGFSGPSVLDPAPTNPIPNQVIDLLNKPVSQGRYNLVNP